MSGIDCSPADYSEQAPKKDSNFGVRVQWHVLVGCSVILYQTVSDRSTLAFTGWYILEYFPAHGRARGWTVRKIKRPKSTENQASRLGKRL
jgi:hypothetical protein